MNMSDMTKKLYPVTGMHCAACAGNVEKIVRKQEGVENASVNLAAATLAVTYNPDIVSPQQLKEAVMKIGFDLIIDEDNSVQEQEEAEQSYYGQLKRKTIVAWIFALPVAVLGMFLMNVPDKSFRLESFSQFHRINFQSVCRQSCRHLQSHVIRGQLG